MAGTHVKVTLTEAGTLQDVLLDSEYDKIDSLTVSGKFSSVDQKYLREATGRIANLEFLDLTDIEIVECDEAHYVWTESYGLDLNTLPSHFYILSPTERTDSKQVGNNFHSRTTYYYHYSPNLDYGFSRDNQNLKEVRLPKASRSVGISIFRGIYGALEKVVLPEGCKKVGESAFDECSALETLVNSENIDSIGNRAFYYTQKLNATFAPLRYVGNYAFENSNIQSVSFASGIKAIPEEAFMGCANLKNVTIPESLESIDQSAFSSCTSLETIAIPGSVETIGNYAFYNCTGLTKVSIGEGTRYLGDYSFSGCSNATDFTLPSTIVGIGTDALKDVPLVADIENGVQYIGTVAYKRIDESITDIVIREGTSCIASYAFCNSPITSVSLPSTLKGISSGAFDDCKALEEIMLPDGLESIGDRAFIYCNKLSSITIPASVTDIGDEAFKGCPGLVRVNWNVIDCADKVPYYMCDIFEDSGVEVVNIGEGVKRIPIGYFDGLQNLIKVNISSTVEEIGRIGTYFSGDWEYTYSGGFTSCPKLKTVTFAENSQLKLIGNGAFSGCAALKEISIPANVEIIGMSAFQGSALEKVTFAEGSKLKEIMGGAFAYCTSLTSIELPEGLNVIGGEDKENYIDDGAFAGCTALSSVELKEGLISIGDYAFSGCPLKEVAFPASLEYIGDDSFSNGGRSTDLEKVTFAEGSNLKEIGEYAFQNTSLTSIELPQSLTGLGKDAFSYCSKLEKVVIPAGCKLDSISSSAFWDCPALESIVIPEGIKKIGDAAFYSTGLKSVVLPASINSLVGYPFGDMSLDDMYILFKDPEIGRQAFNFSRTKLGGTLHVPYGMKDAFWSISSYSSCFDDCVEFGAPSDAEVISESTEIDMSGLSDEADNSNVLVDGIYYALDEANGDGYLPDEGCLVLNSSMSDEQMEAIDDANGSDPSVLVAYKGMAFEVPKGEGWVDLDVEVFGNRTLLMKVGEKVTPILDDGVRAEYSIRYIVNENSRIYLYATEKTASARSDTRAVASDDCVKIYSVKVEVTSNENKETITIGSANQVPYYSDQNLDFTNKPDLKAYVATGYDKATGTIWLTRVKQVPANTGFLLIGEAGDYDIPVVESVADCYYKNMFKGTLTGTTIYTTDGAYTNYYLSKGTSGVGFYKVTNENGQKIGANRCYLPILTDIPANGAEGDAEVIKVSAAKQVPYYTSKNIDFSTLDAQGVKAYTATGYNYTSGVIWLTRVKKVPAQTGILVMTDKEGEYSVPTTSVQSVYENMFTGSETAQTIYTTETVGDITYINYYLSNGESGVGFYKVTKEDGVSMGANRSYLQIPKRDSAAGARGMFDDASSSFRKMVISDGDDDVIAIPLFAGDATSISDVQQRVGEKDVYYNLQGQRVEKPSKGLFIRNGKKVVIK